MRCNFCHTPTNAVTEIVNGKKVLILVNHRPRDRADDDNCPGSGQVNLVNRREQGKRTFFISWYIEGKLKRTTLHVSSKDVAIAKFRRRILQKHGARIWNSLSWDIRNYDEIRPQKQLELVGATGDRKIR